MRLPFTLCDSQPDAYPLCFPSLPSHTAHASCEDLIGFTERVLRAMAIQATGSTVVTLPAGSPADSSSGKSAAGASDGRVSIDLAEPFGKLDILETLAANGVVLPPNYNDPAAAPELARVVANAGIKYSGPQTNAKLLGTIMSLSNLY